MIKNMERKSRQAISPLIATVILIAATITVGSFLILSSTDMVKTSMLVDSIDIRGINIQNTDTASYITANVKNDGNSDLTGVKIIILLPNDDTFEAVFNPVDIRSGITTSINTMIKDESGNPVYLPTGAKYLVEIRADTTGGGIVSETVGLRPS